MGRAFPQICLSPRQEIDTIFSVAQKEEKVDESGMQIQQVLVAADEKIDCLNES